MYNELGGIYNNNISDIGVDGSRSYKERMKDRAKHRLTKGYRPYKWGPRTGRGTKLLMTAGPQSISEIRNANIEWKRPSRTYKTNQIDLIRKGNQTFGNIINQYAP